MFSHLCLFSKLDRVINLLAHDLRLVAPDPAKDSLICIFKLGFLFAPNAKFTGEY
ncbi:hypothetical protein YC2023_094423 [Brassica napus]